MPFPLNNILSQKIRLQMETSTTAIFTWPLNKRTQVYLLEVAVGSIIYY